MPQAIYINAKLSSPLENLPNIYLELFTCCNLRYFKSVVDKKTVLFPQARERKEILYVYTKVSQVQHVSGLPLYWWHLMAVTQTSSTLCSTSFSGKVCLCYYFNFFPIKPSTKSVKVSHVKLHTKITTAIVWQRLGFSPHLASYKTLLWTTDKMWVQGEHESLGRILQKQAMGKSRAEDEELCLETWSFCSRKKFTFNKYFLRNASKAITFTLYFWIIIRQYF